MRQPDFELPLIVGHRGVTETGPENTLAAIERAAAEGATWVEFDVQLSGDKVPVLFHDDTLARTTSGTGRLIDTKAADLVRLDAGSWFSRAFKNAKIPTFAEAATLCRDLDLGMNIEVKPGLGDPAATTAAALKALETLAWRDRQQILISSFEHESLVAARDLAPDIPRGYLMHEIPANWLSLMQVIEATTLHTSYRYLKQTTQEKIQIHNYPIMVYSVDTPQDALRMAHREIESLCTGTPALIAKTLTGAGFRERL